MTAFGHPDDGTFMYYMDAAFEIVFVSDSCLQFFLEYYDDRTRKPVRNLYKIAMHYVKGRFIYDAITIIPFAKLFKGIGKLNRLFNAIKIVRISKGYYLMSTSKFKQNIKAIFDSKLQQKIHDLQQESIIEKDDNVVDHTGIDSQIKIITSFKMTKLIITILGTSYFLGLFWYIVCDLKEIIDPEPFNFLVRYFKDSDGAYRRSITCMYYAFTSLSTVGFGDLHPINNFERLFCAVVLLVGNAIFGYVLGLFRDMV